MDAERTTDDAEWTTDLVAADSGLLRVRVTVAPAEDRLVRLHVGGELDSDTADLFVEVLADVVTRLTPAVVRIDVAGVTFMDSSGIRGLLIGRENALRSGCRVVLTDPAPQVLRVLEISALLDVFGLEATVGPAAVLRAPHVTRAGSSDPLAVMAQSATIRQAARETRERAQAAHGDDPARTGRPRAPWSAVRF